MCHRMDPLPASREVTLIRKTMAGIIEDFACDGTLPSDITGEIIVTNKKKPITAYDIMKAKEEAEKQADSSYQKKREDERATETGVDRELKVIMYVKSPSMITFNVVSLPMLLRSELTSHLSCIHSLTGKE